MIQYSDDEIYITIEEEKVGYMNLTRADQWTTVMPLLFLDEPGLQMYISPEPDLLTLLQCFIPVSLLNILSHNVNHHLQSMVERETLSPDIFESKKFLVQEIYQYLGMNILFGIQRLPHVDEYWHGETYLRGCLYMIMQEGRYKFIGDHYMNFFESSDYYKAFYLTEKIRKKWKQLYKPDQELILYKHVAPSYTSYYLFDSGTMYVLDVAIVFPEQGISSILNMILHYSQLNHVVYVSDDCLDIDGVCTLVHNLVHPVCYLSQEYPKQFLDQFQEDGARYIDDKMCYVRKSGKIFICPQLGIDVDYGQQLQDYLSQTRVVIQKINLYKNPFSYHSHVSMQNDNDEPPKVIQYIKVLFEEYLEVTIYNTFCFHHSILINNQQKPTFKQFKLAVAAGIIGERYQQLERDVDFLSRSQVTTCKDTQTDRISFGMPQSFPLDEYHLPSPIDRHALVKYCVVCMGEQMLSKSYYHCLLCFKRYGYEVYPCISPCFDMFHRDPHLYIQQVAASHCHCHCHCH